MLPLFLCMVIGPNRYFNVAAVRRSGVEWLCSKEAFHGKTHAGNYCILWSDNGHC